jgi:DnaJ-class molecular chaperone
MAEPEAPINLRLPARCPECGEKGTVAVETNVTGTRVQLLRWCRRCNSSWTVESCDESLAEDGA